MMQAIIERCCGLDVHQETVVACLLIGAPGAQPKKEVRTFRTVTRDLEALRDWLQEAGATHVGMESTGVYWRPVYAVLEGQFELIVGNARHIRNVPGRKTDVKDSEWIADLVRHGLIAKSFVPPRPLRELRELLRYRRKLVESQAAERNRLLKLLETANIKLASVASDVFGVSGRAMLRALIEGEASPEAMAGLARGQLRRKRADLILALDGRVEEHHRFLLAMQLRRLEAIEADIAALDQRIGERLEPYSAPHALLMQIPGVDWVVAAVLIAEIGVDMSVFVSVYHLAAWAGVCPGSHESAGRQKSGRARKGNIHLRTILVGAAISASRTKGSYLKDKYHRLKTRRGALRAALAIAHKILVSAYHMLAKNLPYRDLGEAYLDQIGQTRTVANLKRRLERLGYKVTLEPSVRPT
jgi:transposase